MKIQVKRMQNTVSRLLLLAFLPMLLIIMACPTGDDTDTSGSAWEINDTPVTTLDGTLWSDTQLPESLIQFNSATQVQLTGRYWTKWILNVPGLSGSQIDLSGARTCEIAGDISGDWATADGDEVPPTVYILMDTNKRTGIELYLYKADTATGKHQRLVVYRDGILQPREFYLVN